LSHADQSLLAQDLSFEVESVDTLAKAFDCLNKGEFDVILLDLMLPDSKGIESLISLKEKTADTPIVIQTASEDENIIVRAFQMGANGYLRKKNLDSNLLIYAIRLAIERQQYNNRLSES